MAFISHNSHRGHTSDIPYKGKKPLVPPEKISRSRTPPNPLWDQTFKVRFPYLQSLSEEDIRQYGVRVSENEHLDAVMEKHFVMSELCINDMFEMWKRHVTISVVNFEDTETIYKLVQTHIQLFKRLYEEAINVEPGPLADLILLDEFSGQIYTHAVHIYNQQSRDLAKSGNFMGAYHYTMNNLRKTPLKRTKVGKDHRGDIHFETLTRDMGLIQRRPEDYQSQKGDLEKHLDTAIRGGYRVRD